MKRLAILLFLVLVAVLQIGTAAQSSLEDRRELRNRLDARFDIVALTNGIALRPKSAMKDVRLIEITDGSVLVNGAPVTGSELRERLGADAEAVLRASYLDADARRALVEPDAAEKDKIEAEAPPLEAPATATDPAPPADRPSRREIDIQRRSSGDRIRIFGDVSVPAGDVIGGQVVAVLGSAHIDGEVRDQVVAVLGSVELGPNAIVRNDVVSVGGRVRRAPGAQILGAVTEVSISDPNVRVNFEPLIDWRGFAPFEHFSAFPRLIGTTFRFLLLMLLVSMALVVARPTVDASAQRITDRPLQTTLVGMAAQVLVVPVLILTCVVLAISIIGIPLLLLMPFVVIALLLMALAGFSGTVMAVGQWTRRRLGMATAAPFVDMLIGLVMILMPVLLGRVIALAGWPGTPLAFVLLTLGFVVELVAWSSGFGAVLSNGFSRWRARRAARTVGVQA